VSGKDTWQTFLKNKKIFAECRTGTLGKIYFLKNKKNSLSSVRPRALGEAYFQKKLCRVPDLGHSAKLIFKKIKNSLSSGGSRALGEAYFQKIKNSLLSARSRALVEAYFLKK
jgi:hypothetical protein